MPKSKNKISTALAVPAGDRGARDLFFAAIGPPVADPGGHMNVMKAQLIAFNVAFDPP